MHLSVHLLCYLLINHWTKFNQIWCVCVCVTLMKLAPNGKKNIWPYPLGIGQISFSFKDFYTKLCVCSYKRKIQNISVGIFILSPGPCPRGETPLCYILINHWTKFKQFWCVCVCVCVCVTHINGARNGKTFWPCPPGALGRDQKVKYHLISKFLYQTLCVFSQMKDTKHISRDFFSVAWVMP